MKFTNIISSLLGDIVKINVYKVLSLHQEGLTGRGLAALIGTSPFKINQVLRQLEAQGVVQSSVVGKAHLYRLNISHILVTGFILPLIEQEQEIFRKLGQGIIDRLAPHPPLSVILYGSVARGEEEPDSDLDLLLLYEDSQYISTKDAITANHRVFEWVNREYGNRASIRHDWIADFKRDAAGRDPLVQNIIKEGRSIAGLAMTEVLNYGS